MTEIVKEVAHNDGGNFVEGGEKILSKMNCLPEKGMARCISPRYFIAGIKKIHQKRGSKGRSQVPTDATRSLFRTRISGVCLWNLFASKDVI